MQKVQCGIYLLGEIARALVTAAAGAPILAVANN